MKYKILAGDTAHFLEECVNESIAFGWKPIGGVNLTVDNYGNKVWIQAIVVGDQNEKL